jgi:hypothetical protein
VLSEEHKQSLPQFWICVQRFVAFT